MPDLPLLKIHVCLLIYLKQELHIPALSTIQVRSSHFICYGCKTSLLTSSLISPSFQGGPTIFHKGNFLKHTPFSKNVKHMWELYFHTLLYVARRRELKQNFYNALLSHECSPLSLVVGIFFSFCAFTHVPALIAVPQASPRAWILG